MVQAPGEEGRGRGAGFRLLGERGVGVEEGTGFQHVPLLAPFSPACLPRGTHQHPTAKQGAMTPRGFLCAAGLPPTK